MKLIPLNHGLFAKVDDADYAELAQFKWREQDGYAVRSLPRNGKPPKIERMHRRLLGLTDADRLDGEHEDHDRLNNQRYNLRVATRSQNVQNSKLRSDNKTGFKGVTWRPDNGNYQAQLNVGKKNRHLGYFKTAEDANEFRMLAAEMCHGSFVNHG